MFQVDKEKGIALDWSIVVAMTPRRVIGRNNRLPWHYKEDLRWFRQLTTGHTVLMGRKTYDSIGKALPNRKNLVLTRQNLSLPDAVVLSSLEQAAKATNELPDVFVIGGEHIYREALPFCSQIFLTRIKLEYEGDTYFPAFEEQFKCVETISETPDLIIERHVRA